MNYNKIFDSLKRSKFRSSFHLSNNDKEYVNKKGIEKIREHAFDFVNKRIAPQSIINDGRQTPMKGHPVFVAQHATATCCRGCLYKWHNIKPGVKLSEEQIQYVVQVIMKWIEYEIKNVNF